MAVYLENNGVLRQESKSAVAILPIQSIVNVGKRLEADEYLKIDDVVLQTTFPACEVVDIRLMVNKPMPAGSKVDLVFINTKTLATETFAADITTAQEGVIVVGMPRIGHYYEDGSAYTSERGGIWLDNDIAIGFKYVGDADLVPGDYEIDVVYTILERKIKTGAYLS